VRFKSDAQRRACFANINKFSLYIDKETGNVHSSVYPEVNVEIEPESVIGRRLTYKQAVDALGETNERDFAGLNKIVMVDNTSIGPDVYGEYDRKTKGIIAAVPFIGDPRDGYIDKYKDVLGGVSEGVSSNFKKHDNAMALFDEPDVNSPAVTIRHEIGHHIDPAISSPSGSFRERLDLEPFADSYAINRIDPEIKDKIDFALALQNQKVITYDDVLRYVNDV